MQERRMVLWLCLAVFAVTFLLFLPSVTFSLVGWDDMEYVSENVRIHGGLTWQSVRWSFFSCGYADNWHPLAWLSMALDVSVARLLTGGIRWNMLMKDVSALSAVLHGHNALLHALNASLLFLVLLSFVRPQRSRDGVFAWVCAFLALLWALHPLRAEVVCWVSERKEVLSVFFMLLSLSAFFVATERSSALMRIVSLACFSLALLAKPVAVTMPTVIFTWLWVVRREPFRTSFAYAIPYGILSAICCVLTMCAQTGAMPCGIVTLWTRVVSALCAPLVYMVQTLCPVGLSICYADAPTGLALLGAVAGVLLLVAFGWVLVRWYCTRSELLAVGVFGIVWCYVGLVPMLGIIKVGSQPHSDRYTYWIGCGFAVVACLVANWCADRWGRLLTAKRAKWLAEAAGCLLAAVAVFTCVRSRVWRNSETLFRDAVEKNDEPMLAELYARVLLDCGKAVESESFIRGYVSDHPSPVSRVYFALYLLGREPCNENDVAEAVYCIRRAEEDYPECAEIQQAYGDVARVRGDWDAALRHYETARRRGLISKGLSERLALARKKTDGGKGACTREEK